MDSRMLKHLFAKKVMCLVIDRSYCNLHLHVWQNRLADLQKQYATITKGQTPNAQLWVISIADH